MEQGCFLNLNKKRRFANTFCMSRENQKKIIIFGIYTGVTGIVILSFKYLLPLVTPFVFALLIAALIEKPVAFLEKNWHIKRTAGSVIAVVILSVILILTAYFGGRTLINQIRNFMENSGKYCEKAKEIIGNFCKKFDGLFCLKEGSSYCYVDGQVQNIMRNLSEKGGSIAINNSKNLISGFTMLFTAFAITIMGTLFISKDMENFKQGIRKNYFKKEIIFIGARLKAVLGTYFKTEFIIMSITSAICIVGLLFLKNKYAFLLGIIIGLVDALPILGTGTIFIPWSIVLLLMRNIKKAAFIFVLYLVCYYVRQFLEPKLMGDKFGISPVIMLLSIYAGLKLFGIMGVFLGPIALILSKELSAMIIKNL